MKLREYNRLVFKTDAFFISLKEEIPNKSVSEILGSVPLKNIFIDASNVVEKKLIFHLKKLDNEGDNEQ